MLWSIWAPPLYTHAICTPPPFPASLQGKMDRVAMFGVGKLTEHIRWGTEWYRGVPDMSEDGDPTDMVKKEDKASSVAGGCWGLLMLFPKQAGLMLAPSIVPRPSCPVHPPCPRTCR